LAVYTEVSWDDACALLRRLGLGELHCMQGCAGGIENTNYFVSTTRNGQAFDYVLTLFERLGFAQLPFYLHLMKHLAQNGIAVPDPSADGGGQLVHEIAGKPVAVVNKLPGQSELAPTPAHCAAVGDLLARMHLVGQSFGMKQAHLRGLSWWNETVPVVLPYLRARQAALLQSELAFQNQMAASRDYAALPRGPIHADLFRDNVMFQTQAGRPKLTGCFDFYFAGVDTWLFDLAVCLNDWCIEHISGHHAPEHAQRLMAAYSAVRPLSQAEQNLLPAMLRAGALRFWLSRLWDFYLPRSASLLKAHDPSHFERVLRARLAHPFVFQTAGACA
jgi:homoserine kinase type II